MASILLGSHVTDIRGKVGGHVYSQSRSGNTLSNKANPVGKRRSNAANNIANKNLTVANAIAWTGLTSGQVASWKSAASSIKISNRLGVKFTPTAYNWYMRVNNAIALVGGTPITTPVAQTGITNLKGVIFSSSAHGSVTVSTAVTGTANEIIVMKSYIARSVNAAFRYNKSKIVYQAIGNQSQPINITSALTSYLGTLQAGQVLWVYMYVVNKLTGESGGNAVAYAILT